MDELGPMPNIAPAHKGVPPRREDPEGAVVVAQMLPATQLAESEHKLEDRILSFLSMNLYLAEMK
jgi:hypothetical protein